MVPESTRFTMPKPAAKAPRSDTLPCDLPAEVIREKLSTLTRSKLLGDKFSPRSFQLDAAVSIVQKRDTLLNAPTGSGKTIVLVMPLLLYPGKVTMIISPLHALQEEQCKLMNMLGFPSIVIDTFDMDKRTLKVCTLQSLASSSRRSELAVSQKLESGHYAIIFVAVEIMEENKGLVRLLSSAKLRSKLLFVSVDEVHCISQWGESFRTAYSRIGQLRARLPPKLPFFICSATLPPAMLKDILTQLDFSPSATAVKLPNNRSNIFLANREMEYTKGSYRDLEFLVPASSASVQDLRRSIVYFDRCVIDCGERMRADSEA